jgi:hypothetical protein
VAQESPWSSKYSTFIMEEWYKGQWSNLTKRTNTFDSNGNIIQNGSYMWNDTTKVWETNTRVSHTLNANSTINFSIYQMWNKDTNSWEDWYKDLYTYDSAKNILTLKEQNFFGIGWFDISMTTYTYNASGQLTKDVYREFNLSTSKWETSGQQTYSYNADGTQNQNSFQSWNQTTSSWENISRSTYSYYDSKKMASEIYEGYSSGSWVMSTKTMISYNADGSMKEVLFQNWNASGGNWVDSAKSSYTSNPDGTISQVIETTWMPATSTWENQARETFTYGITSIGQQLAGTEQLKVFPNPFSNFISIEYNSMNVSDIQLFNSNGQLVRNIGKGEPLSNINLSALKNGVYILKVNAPESQKVVKLMKYK